MPDQVGDSQQKDADRDGMPSALAMPGRPSKPRAIIKVGSFIVISNSHGAGEYACSDQKCQMMSAAKTVSRSLLPLSKALVSSELYQATSGRNVTEGENQCCQPMA